MARYVDGFVLPVPLANMPAYKKMARLAGKVWKEHGALEYVECIADDVKPGKLTSFPQSVKLKEGEVVVFSYIVYPSQDHVFRWQAHVLGRLQAVSRALAIQAVCCGGHCRIGLGRIQACRCSMTGEELARKPSIEPFEKSALLPRVRSLHPV